MKTSGQKTTLDTASLERARALVGLKGYVTNITADVMPPAEVWSAAMFSDCPQPECDDFYAANV
ncbi:hypothetical protein ACFFRQ_12120, partial [Pseudoclavibacter helvolus]